MPIHTTKLGAATLLAGALFAAGAQAQTAAPAAGAQPAQAQPNPSAPVKLDMQALQGTDWTKVCGKPAPGQKETCFTTRDFTTDPKQPPQVALAIYDVKGEDNRVARVLLPIGLMLRPGVRFSVDKGAATPGAYEFCMPNGCFAETQISGKVIEQMKKGTVLNVVAKGPAGNEITFALPLANFGKGFDGAPIPTEVLQKRQEEQQAELQKQLQERALAQRQALEKGAAGAAPAAGAPAPAAGAAPAPAAPAKP
ncbi:invasion associated locus B family protein [Lichenibacterium dinghuense]|uniref:invasion associated locus B family protein n=1 Tax=Lichenibacterium dinghuense TaxID=2895977 RepID=UPI001F410A32|nr:invasion associated locus B family protein [Lichenibacterium sp. 6Y81]